ncbi:MAG: hypothetical protein M1819_004880 [Sarea resinae]|nr:MAG: hypothetical protein M1819_004880 [Sarea resinae]
MSNKQLTLTGWLKVGKQIEEPSGEPGISKTLSSDASASASTTRLPLQSVSDRANRLAETSTKPNGIDKYSKPAKRSRSQSSAPSDTRSPRAKFSRAKISEE